jgi:cytochrome c553
MSVSDQHHPHDRPWRFWGTAIVSTILLFGVLSGFVIMPLIQGYQAGIDPYTAICRALGIVAGSPGAPQPISQAQAAPVSSVAWTPQLFGSFTQERATRGRELAASTCVSCHGEQGLSADPAQFPNMAGQSSFAIYKQLHDYKSGARRNEIMQPIVDQLSEDQMTDVAAYYANQQQARWDRTWVQSAAPENEKLVRQGDSARGLPACESCHNPLSGGPIETPVLFAQTKDYLKAQLHAYKAGTRQNDLYSRMRNIAAKLSDEEIDQLAQYYFERR